MRNLRSLTLSPHPSTNFIVGPNGSGKTSLLEAIGILSSGRSFRTPILKKVVTHDCADLVVFAEIQANADAECHRVGIRRALSGETLIKIDGEKRDRLSELAALVPTVELCASSFEWVDGGPGERRQILDWGLFHVEHSYADLVRRYRVVLSQKNALLKSGDRRAISYQLVHWNQQLAELGDQIDRFRLQYVVELRECLDQVLAGYFPDLPLSLTYRSGWSQSQYESLADCLAKNQETEMERGSCLYGPHRADLVISWSGESARDMCSRGQKKLVLYAVRLAQVMLLLNKNSVRPILLLDDLPAELDATNIEKVTRFLSDYPCQTFITAITKDVLEGSLLSSFRDHRLFHVEHGQLMSEI